MELLYRAIRRTLKYWDCQIESESSTAKRWVIIKDGKRCLMMIRLRNIPSTESDDSVFTFADFKRLQQEHGEYQVLLLCYAVWHEKDDTIRCVIFDIDQTHRIPTWGVVEHGYRIKIRTLNVHKNDAYALALYDPSELTSDELLDALLADVEAMHDSSEGEHIARYRKLQGRFRALLLKRSSCLRSHGIVMYTTRPRVAHSTMVRER